MIYTNTDYTNDLKTARYTFRKYIGSHYLKEELIHLAVVKLWTTRLEFGGVIDPVRIARNLMFNHIRNEKRHDYRDSLNDTFCDNEDLMLIDTIASRQPTAFDYLQYHDLVKKLLPLPSQLSGRDRQIISLHLKHYTQREIARRVGISQPYVNRIIKNFRVVAREILDKD